MILSYFVTPLVIGAVFAGVILVVMSTGMEKNLWTWIILSVLVSTFSGFFVHVMLRWEQKTFRFAAEAEEKLKPIIIPIVHIRGYIVIILTSLGGLSLVAISTWQKIETGKFYWHPFFYWAVVVYLIGLSFGIYMVDWSRRDQKRADQTNLDRPDMAKK